MTNLLKEVTPLIEEYGEPKCIKIYNRRISWDRFRELAAETEYDSGYGGHEIEGSLMLMWDTIIAVRAVYDGAEWFEVVDISIPDEDISDKVTSLKYDFWDDDTPFDDGRRDPIGGE